MGNEHIYKPKFNFLEMVYTRSFSSVRKQHTSHDVEVEITKRDFEQIDQLNSEHLFDEHLDIANLDIARF